MLLDTPICDFGWQAPKFELKDADGTSYAFDDVMGAKGLLIAFICNHCPYVKRMIDNLVADATLLQAEGIGVVAIMSNDYQKYDDDSPENMKKFALQSGMDFPYLLDETQEIARAYDAVCTPDFFGLNAQGTLQYRGRLDNASKKSIGDRQTDLLNAMRLIAKTGQGPQEQTASMGCSIKWR